MWELLTGALEALFGSAVKVWADWHNKSGVSPEGVSQEVANIAAGVATVISDVEGIYQETKKQVLEKHPEMPHMQARLLSATAAEHVAAEAKKKA